MKVAFRNLTTTGKPGSSKMSQPILRWLIASEQFHFLQLLQVKETSTNRCTTKQITPRLLSASCTILTTILKDHNKRLPQQFVFLLENASYHTTAQVKSFFRRTGLRLMFTVPHSYDCVPIERLFMYVKSKKIDPEQKIQTDR